MDSHIAYIYIDDEPVGSILLCGENRLPSRRTMNAAISKMYQAIIMGLRLYGKFNIRFDSSEAVNVDVVDFPHFLFVPAFSFIQI